MVGTRMNLSASSDVCLHILVHLPHVGDNGSIFSVIQKKLARCSFFCCLNMIGIITYHHEYRTHNNNREEKTSAQAGGDGKGATLHHRIADEDSSQMRQSKLPMCGRKRTETSSSSFNHKDQRKDPCDLRSSGYG